MKIAKNFRNTFDLKLLKQSYNFKIFDYKQLTAQKLSSSQNPANENFV